jgi:hypothetical protein
MPVRRRDLKEMRRLLRTQHKQFCVRDGCTGIFDVVGGDDGAIHIECPKCGFTSAGRSKSPNPFEVGCRVRCVGYPLVGAGTIAAVDSAPSGDMIVYIKFDEGKAPRPDYEIAFGGDGSVGVLSAYLEPLYP